MFAGIRDARLFGASTSPQVLLASVCARCASVLILLLCSVIVPSVSAAMSNNVANAFCCCNVLCERCSLFRDFRPKALANMHAGLCSATDSPCAYGRSPMRRLLVWLDFIAIPCRSVAVRTVFHLLVGTVHSLVAALHST